MLTIAKAKAATGTALRDNVRKIAKATASRCIPRSRGCSSSPRGKEINYEGASGPCDFTDIGDIKDCKFRYQVAEDGKFKFLSVS